MRILAALLAVAACGGAAPPPPVVSPAPAAPPATREPPAPRPSPSPEPDPLLAVMPECRTRRCEVVARLSGVRLHGESYTFAAIGPADSGLPAFPEDTSYYGGEFRWYVVRERDRKVVASLGGPDGRLRDGMPSGPVTDRSGNVLSFVGMNTASHVDVLRLGPDGVLRDLGRDGERFVGATSNTEVADVDGDGRYEIVIGGSNWNDPGARWFALHEVYAWDGRDYAFRFCTLSTDGGEERTYRSLSACRRHFERDRR